jgi:outer membrane protein
MKRKRAIDFYSEFLLIFSMASISLKNILILFMTALMIFFHAEAMHALTLKEAKDEALRKNLDIKISGEKVSEAQSAKKASFTKLFPELSTNSYGTYMDKPTGLFIEKGAYGTYPFGPSPLRDSFITTNERDIYRLGIKIEQPVFTGGKIYYSYRQSKSVEEEIRWSDKQTVQDVLFLVETAYYNLLKAEDMKKSAEQHEITLKAHLADMEQLYQKGRVAFIDILKVRVQLSRAGEDVVKTNNDVAVAKVQLNLVLNRPLEQVLEVIPLGNPQAVPISVQDAEKEAKSKNNALNSARTKKITAELQRRIVEADYYPSITLTGGYYTQNKQPSSPDEQLSVMLSMDWSLWHWGETHHKVDAARAYERQIEYAVSSLESQIAANVKDDFYQIDQADKRIDVAKDALVQAEENLRITQVGFSNGRKTSTDVLDAEDLLSKSQSDYLQAFYDAHAARSHLRYVMGAMESEGFLPLSLSAFRKPAEQEKYSFE